MGALGENIEYPVSRADRGKILRALREQDRERKLREAESVLNSSKKK